MGETNSDSETAAAPPHNPSFDDMLSKLQPDKIASLEKLLDRADVLNQLLERADAMQQSGALDSLTSLTYALKTLLDALHEDTVGNLALTAGSLIEIGKAVSRPEVKDRMVELLDKEKLESLVYAASRLDELRRAGTLDALFDMAYLVKTLRDMLTDDSVANLSAKLASLLEIVPLLPDLAKPLTTGAVSAMLQATASEEVAEALNNPPKVGYRALIATLRDEDMQRGLGFLLVLGKAVGKKVQENSSLNKYRG